MRIIFCLVLLLFCKNSFAQQEFPHDYKYYNFVDYSKNKIIFGKDSSRFEKLFTKLDSLIKYGQSSLKILQLGASHTQADIFSGRLRYRLQDFHPGINGSRGYVFPYKLAKSNNPSSYQINCSGFWSTCRNVEYKRACSLGLSGVSAITYDENATMNIKLTPKYSVSHDFNLIRILSLPNIKNFDVKIDDMDENYQVIKDEVNGFIDIKLKNYRKEFTMYFVKGDSLQDQFCFCGAFLYNDNAGITLDAIGINGASITSWLSCTHFESQLKYNNYDWVLIFLGVNDGYTYNFKPEYFQENYEKLIRLITRTNPNVAITMIMPNDCYLYRKRPNPSMVSENEIMHKLVDKYNISMWSLFEIMQGLGGSTLWVQNMLMASDRIHLTGQGYIFSADLLFSAFVHAWENHLNASKNQ